MKTIFTVLFFACAIKTYPYWSYKAYLDRCEINAQHPDFIPYSGMKCVSFPTDTISKFDTLCCIGVLVFGILMMYSYFVNILK